MATLTTYNRGIRQLMLGVWTGVNTWPITFPVTGARQANLSWVVDSDKARGDDVDLDRYTRIVSAQITIAQASVDLRVANAVLGGALVSNADYYDLVIGGSNDPPYIGIAGRVAGSNGGGDLQFLIPKAKLSSSPQFNAQVDTYIFPQMQFEGVYEGTLNGIMRLRHFVLPTLVAMPLATSGGGG